MTKPRFTIRYREPEEGSPLAREQLALCVRSSPGVSNPSTTVHWLDVTDVPELKRVVDRWMMTAGSAMHRLLICGSRDWDDPDPIRYLIKSRVARVGVSRVVVIHGDARGADTIAEGCARALGVHTARVAALWGDTGYGRSAGPMRNGTMLGLDPTEVVAFTKDMTGGTANMCRSAIRAGVPVRWFRGR